MINSLLMIGMIMNEILLVDFNTESDVNNWVIITNKVMGGISAAEFICSNGTAEFSGILSSENNGGFASVRIKNIDIINSNYTGIIVRVKGDGKIYSVRFRTDDNFDGVSYEAKFKTNNLWQEYRLGFDEFKPKFRGRIIPNQPELESKNIKQVGIMAADKQFGNFIINIEWIKLYKEKF